MVISIHTLRVEGDDEIHYWTYAEHVFQSTPSGWRVTLDYAMVISTWYISIHTLRVEGDLMGDDIDLWLQISIHTLRVEGDVAIS
jgi:hypothetical protein